MNGELTFKGCFASGVTATVRVAKSPPVKGESHIRDVEWTGNPCAKHLRRYVEWMNCVNQQLADEWGIRLMHVFQTTPRDIEIWGYAPGEKPHPVDLAANGANEI